MIKTCIFFTISDLTTLFYKYLQNFRLTLCNHSIRLMEKVFSETLMEGIQKFAGKKAELELSIGKPNTLT